MIGPLLLFCLGVKVVSIDNGRAGSSLLLVRERCRGGGVETRWEETDDPDEDRSRPDGERLRLDVEGESELRLGEGARRGDEGIGGMGMGRGIATLARGLGDLEEAPFLEPICVRASADEHRCH